MKTILLEDFLDDGIIKEKSFREKINLMNFEIFSDEKVIIKAKTAKKLTDVFISFFIYSSLLF